jgi:hypothetical protein
MGGSFSNGSLGIGEEVRHEQHEVLVAQAGQPQRPAGA